MDSSGKVLEMEVFFLFENLKYSLNKQFVNKTIRVHIRMV